MHRLSDLHLLEKLKEGDKSAFDTFFIRYYKLLLANALFYTKDEPEAKDIVQDFLFEFYHKKLYLRLEGDMKGYLYRSIRHRCFNLRRKKALEQQHAWPEHGISAPDEDYDSSEEDFVRLEEAISNLPPQRKEVLHRIYFEEKKYQDAADEMGISLNTLKTHLKIGLKNLRENLKK